MRSTRIAAGLLALSFAAAISAAEPAADESGGFWWSGLDLGGAYLARSFSVTPDTSDTEYAMAFRVGYAWHPSLLLGLELGGFTIQPTDYAGTRGEAIQQTFVIAQYYPVDRSPFFLKAGFGHVRYWNNRLGEGDGSGVGGAVGVGYDFAMTGPVHFTPLIEYSMGKYDNVTSPPGITQDQRYRAISLKLGLTFRSRGYSSRTAQP